MWGAPHDEATRGYTKCGAGVLRVPLFPPNATPHFPPRPPFPISAQTEPFDFVGWDSLADLGAHPQPGSLQTPAGSRRASSAARATTAALMAAATERPSRTVSVSAGFVVNLSRCVHLGWVAVPSWMGGSPRMPLNLPHPDFHTYLARKDIGVNEVRDAAFLHGYSVPVLLLLHEPDPTWPGRYR